METEILKPGLSEAWIGVIGAVLGALLAVLSAYLTNRASFKQQRQQLEQADKLNHERIRREKLEELYLLVCHWGNMFFGQYMQLSLVMKGHHDYNEYLDAILQKNPVHLDFNKMSMIVDIYGPQLKEAYEKVHAARDAYNEIEALHKAAYLKGESGRAFLKPAGDAQLALGEACDQFKLAIAHSARLI